MEDLHTVTRSRTLSPAPEVLGRSSFANAAEDGFSNDLFDVIRQNLEAGDLRVGFDPQACSELLTFMNEGLSFDEARLKLVQLRMLANGVNIDGMPRDVKTFTFSSLEPPSPGSQSDEPDDEVSSLLGGKGLWNPARYLTGRRAYWRMDVMRILAIAMLGGLVAAVWTGLAQPPTPTMQLAPSTTHMVTMNVGAPATGITTTTTTATPKVRARRLIIQMAQHAFQRAVVKNNDQSSFKPAPLMGLDNWTGY